MKIVVADDLPRSAVDLLRAETGWQVDAGSGRPPADLVAALADADALETLIEKGQAVTGIELARVALKKMWGTAH